MYVIFLYVTVILLIGSTKLIDHPILGICLWVVLLTATLYLRSAHEHRKRPTK